MAAVDASVPTPDRLLTAALGSFAARGYEATSLDQIAVESGVRKQTLLYHFASKEELLGAVVDRTVAELTDSLSVGSSGNARREIVDALFRIGARRPELLDLVREVLRLGPPASDRLLAAAEPLLARASGAVGRDRVLGAAAMIIGMATEADVLAALGVEPNLAQLRRRRRVLLDYLGA